MIARNFALAGLALLAGCTWLGRGGEPSEDEIRAALKLSGYKGGPKAEKLACKTSPERPGVICDYRAPACNRYTGTCGAAKPFTGRFLNTGGRWQLVEDLTPRAQQDPVTQPLPGVVLATPVPTASPTAAAIEPDAPQDQSGPEPEVTTQPQTEPASRPRYDSPSYDVPRYDPAPGGGRLSIDEIGMVGRWLSQNTRCRMGRRGAYETDLACEERERLRARLEAQGLCQTRTRGWERCG